LFIYVLDHEAIDGSNHCPENSRCTKPNSYSKKTRLKKQDDHTRKSTTAINKSKGNTDKCKVPIHKKKTTANNTKDASLKTGIQLNAWLHSLNGIYVYNYVVIHFNFPYMYIRTYVCVYIWYRSDLIQCCTCMQVQVVNVALSC